MSLDYTQNTGGMYHISSALYDGYQPLSLGLVGMLTHNEELVNDTIVPRHLVNQTIPNTSIFDLDNGYYTLEEDVGRRIAQWGRFRYTADMKITLRVYLCMTAGWVVNFYALSTPQLHNGPWTDGGGSEWLYTAYNGTPHLDSEIGFSTASQDSPIGHWLTFDIVPNNNNGKWFYVSLWAKATTLGSDYGFDLMSISMLEGRL